MTSTLVVPYRQSVGGDAALAKAVSEARASGLALRVLVPFEAPKNDARCCGIRGEAWVAQLRAVAEDDAARARALLAEMGADGQTEVVGGDSIPDIVSAYVTESSDRLLALPRGGRRGPFPRSTIRRTARAVAGEPLALDD